MKIKTTVVKRQRKGRKEKKEFLGRENKKGQEARELEGKFLEWM